MTAPPAPATAAVAARPARGHATAAALAHPNIALVKYWGKRDAALNLPAAGSFSVTLAGDGLHTVTRVTFDAALGADVLSLGGRPADAAATAKVSRVLDLVRAEAGLGARARVESVNGFPTGAGLASSSSAFAALALAASRAAGLRLDEAALSVLARRGSGSAARSIAGGFVEMAAGAAADGRDAFATQAAPESHWPELRVLAVLTAEGPKDVPSTGGMDHTAATSPYFGAWVGGVAADVAAARAAVAARDLPALGERAEWSAMKMHASALAARPWLLYWNALTVEVLHAVRAARERGGLGAWATIDAGPHVKVLCAAGEVDAVEAFVRARVAVKGVLRAAPAQGARVLDDAEAERVLGVERSPADSRPGAPQAWADGASRGSA